MTFQKGALQNNFEAAYIVIPRLYFAVASASECFFCFWLRLHNERAGFGQNCAADISAVKGVHFAFDAQGKVHSPAGAQQSE